MNKISPKDLKAYEDLRQLGILITPPSGQETLPFREVHLIGHSTLDSSELQAGDRYYLYANIGERPLLVEVKSVEDWSFDYPNV